MNQYYGRGISFPKYLITMSGVKNKQNESNKVNNLASCLAD
jgi:hypothetical protein